MEYGQIVATRGVADEMEASTLFMLEVQAAFQQYVSGDWGQISEADKKENDRAALEGERVLAAYQTSKGKIWIITEWDRSVTTILFPSEY